MRKILFILVCLCTATATYAVDMQARHVRKAIIDGNAAYRVKNYKEALEDYDKALSEDESNLLATFNKALAQVRLAENLNMTTDSLNNEQRQANSKAMNKYYEEASKNFEYVAKRVSDNPELAQKANYNRGNISFNIAKNTDTEDATKYFQEAISYYKQALRMNPNDNAARRNLRIAQLNLPKNNQDQNQDQNKDQNKEQNQDQDKNKDNQDQQGQDNDQNQQQPQNPPAQPQKQDMNAQSADRLLRRSADKENEARRRLLQGAGGRRNGW
ncbi:MAG: hypothetical protein NC217_08265 [Muribaculaceae bacterium]|nr:hypothetical protein [Muribaculaceae bacterium]